MTLHAPALPGRSLPPGNTPTSAPPIAERPPRLLLLDGDADLSRLVRQPLEQSGYDVDVHVAADNLEALMDETEPNLVLIDVRGKHSSGFELCSELRGLESGRQTPILLLSDQAVDEQQVARGLFCGADDFLCVNDRLVEFQARVRVQLRNKRDRDRLRRIRNERDTYRREAVLDALTGLPNRRAIDARIGQAVGGSAPFGLLFVDIDNFKRVNDTFGHDVGDRVLKAVAHAIERTLRPGDHGGRWGGEEFVVVLGAPTDPQTCKDVAELHRAAVEATEVAQLGGQKVTVSIGLACFDPRYPDPRPEALAHRADAALYQAKRQGKNRVVVALPATATRSMRPGRRSLAPRESDPPTLEGALLKELATGRAGLPLLPEAAAEALRLAEDPRTDMGRIAKLVDRDPPLAARFVAIAGSAVYSRGVKPASTQQALVRIGLAASRDLLLQVVYERANEELPFFRAEVTQSFQRSVRQAVASRVLAREIGPYDYAYPCGLLHDIGEARIYRIFSQMPRALEAGEHVHELVARHHCKAGADVARAWHLAADIVEACEAHHGPPEGASLPVRIVMGADALVRIASRPEPIPTLEEVDLLVAIGVREPRVPGLLGTALAALGEIDAEPR